MKKILILIFLLDTMVFSQVNFLNVNLNEARALARKGNKNILIDFYTDWCVNCKGLDKYIFGDSLISGFINNNYISFKINAETNYGEILRKKLSVQPAYPTVLFLTPDGREIDRIEGTRSNDEYFQTIKNYTENINTFNYLLKKEKNNPNDSLKYQIAGKYFERGKFKKAIKYYGYLIGLDSYNADGTIYYKTAKCYTNMNNVDKAIEYTNKAICKNPNQKKYKDFLEKLSNK
jgi:tetratricopeptide (TPR) repeat protein